MEYVRTAGRMWGRRSNRPKGLWLVQIIEYLIGISLALMVPRSPDAVVLAGCAVAFVGNASTLTAALAAFPVAPPRVHRVIGIVLAVVVVVVALVSPITISTRSTLVVAAVAQGFISVRFGHGFRTTRSRPQQTDRRMGSVGKG